MQGQSDERADLRCLLFGRGKAFDFSGYGLSGVSAITNAPGVKSPSLCPASWDA